MVRTRIIPVLLLKNNGLVKTTRFKNPTYIGDPINVVNIFNEKEVDELIILDINATREAKEPHYIRIKEIVSEAFMPSGYGGGIQTLNLVDSLHRCVVSPTSRQSTVECSQLDQNVLTIELPRDVIERLRTRGKIDWRADRDH